MGILKTKKIPIMTMKKMQIMFIQMRKPINPTMTNIKMPGRIMAINKKLMLAGAVVAMLAGVPAYQMVSPSFAADKEGHPHAHEEGEESHALGAKDEHGHEHAEEPAANDPHDHSAPDKDGDGHDDHGAGGEEGEEHDEGSIKLTPEQMEASGIRLVSVRQGDLSHQVTVPGRLVADADRMAQIVPKVSGIVVEARKNLGDTVKKGEVLALIESREMAESSAEYQAASRALELARTTFNREKTLWEKKVTAEQDYLVAKNSWQEAQIRLDLAKQKMQTLGGMSENQKPSRYHELKSPLDGLIIERDLTLGAFADTSSKAFTVADLSVLWVEISIAPNDLPRVREGQTAIVESAGKQGEGKLIFVSPVINPDTRSAKAIIELQNPDGQWRSGDYSNVSIVTATQQSGMTIPLEAIQTIEGKPVVFVKTTEGFEKRNVTPGKKDDRNIEISSGLQVGEEVAIGNTFVLKAEAGKSEAEHSH